ncbi:thymidine kinase 2, mitochondrial-like [Oppia nitens]|uniref:thymidine kinase 2, mitochondrial-like n=1 Tax=Oppia nitens TaxID=1686743 RepID=UPI0023DA3A88|nr:thymidine kinase 2, mitochondrial-like [Oppia nitens]
MIFTMNGIICKPLAKKMLTVCFEGNIGSGKSSSLKYLCDKYDKVMSLCEPIDKWHDLRGHNLIEMLYKDLTRNAFAFEHFAQLTRLEMYANQQHTDDHQMKPIRLMERSIYSARYCFTQNLFQSGNLSKPEFIILDEWFKWLSSKSCLKVDLIVYLRTSPETVFQRVKNRSRSEEQEIPIDYLRSLHELHDKWLLSDIKQSENSPQVFTLNADLPQKQLLSLLDSHFDHIFKGILN